MFKCLRKFGVFENFLRIHSTGQKILLSFVEVPVFIEKEWTCSSIASLAKNNKILYRDSTSGGPVGSWVQKM